MENKELDMKQVQRICSLLDLNYQDFISKGRKEYNLTKFSVKEAENRVKNIIISMKLSPKIGMVFDFIVQIFGQSEIEQQRSRFNIRVVQQYVERILDSFQECYSFEDKVSKLKKDFPKTYSLLAIIEFLYFLSYKTVKPEDRSGFILLRDEIFLRDFVYLNNTKDILGLDLDFERNKNLFVDCGSEKIFKNSKSVIREVKKLFSKSLFSAESKIMIYNIYDSESSPNYQIQPYEYWGNNPVFNFYKACTRYAVMIRIFQNYQRLIERFGIKELE